LARAANHFANLLAAHRWLSRHAAPEDGRGVDALGVQTAAGGQWHAVTVKRVLERLGQQ